MKKNKPNPRLSLIYEKLIPGNDLNPLTEEKEIPRIKSENILRWEDDGGRISSEAPKTIIVPGAKRILPVRDRMESPLNGGRQNSP